ncbi:MAG: hypothetical protein K8T91_18690 [Planctomycetes bacterium]|nr:hypothetical protein [Planctomycetota bacterium]
MSEQSSIQKENTGDEDAKKPPQPGRKRKKISIPSVNHILHQLIQLNRAVILGAMSTKEANLIHKNLNTVLQVQMKRANREDAGHNQQAMIDICRTDPRMINALEPFLTDAQVRSLMTEDMDKSDESV